MTTPYPKFHDSDPKAEVFAFFMTICLRTRLLIALRCFASSLRNSAVKKV